MGWNLEEFRNLCAARQLPDSTIYQNALQWKLERVEFYAQLAQAVWDNLFAAQEVQLYEVMLGRSQYQIHIESAAQSLHSMADILAQIINLAVLNGCFTEDDVSLDKVLQQLRQANIASDVANAIQRLKGSDAYKYVNAFVNTIKHRKLLDTEYIAEYGEGRRNGEGFIFEPFIYRGTQFPETWAQDIIGEYKLSIMDMINNIGGLVNDYLR